MHSRDEDKLLLSTNSQGRTSLVFGWASFENFKTYKTLFWGSMEELLLMWKSQKVENSNKRHLLGIVYIIGLIAAP